MPNILIANVTATKEKKQVNYKFTVMLDSGIIIPGFHTYSGVIQAPHNKGKNSWYPTVYLPPQIAEGVYKAFVKTVEEQGLDIKLHSLETNLKYLAYDEVVIDRLNMAAEEKEAA
jgi:hypothetical protein